MILNKIIYFFIIIFFTATIFSNAKYEVLDKIIVKVEKANYNKTRAWNTKSEKKRC
jgi:hypothetical protein